MASLLDELEEDERKEKEVKSKQTKEAALRALAIHPLVNEKRDIRDAYFYGLAFAAIADDGKVDVAEKTILSSIAKSLGLPDGEVEEAISELHGKSAKDKMQLITECVKALADNKVGLNLFWAQFIQVWSSRADSKDVLSRLLKRIAEQSGVSFPSSKVSAILSLLKGGDGVDKDMLALADWMGDDALKYFAVKKYGDVSDILNKARRAKASAEKRRKEQSRIDSVRKKFHDKAMDLSRQYGASSRVPQDWAEKFNELFDEIDGADIDWVQECNSVLSALQEIGKGYVGKAIWRPDYQTRRKIAWRLLCMLFVHSGEIKIANDPCRWLRSISNISSEGFRKKVEKFLEENFDITFVIPE